MGRSATPSKRGDKVLYEAKLAQCPVGEFLPDWGILHGSYECARFQNRIWIRPLEQGTVLYLPLKNLPPEFSLEFTVHAFEAGGPFVALSLHADGAVYIGVFIVGARESMFGAQDRPVGCDQVYTFKRVLPARKDHRWHFPLLRQDL